MYQYLISVDRSVVPDLSMGHISSYISDLCVAIQISRNNRLIGLGKGGETFVSMKGNKTTKRNEAPFAPAPIHASTHPSACLADHRSNHPSILPSIHSSILPFIQSSIHPSIQSSTYPSIYADKIYTQNSEVIFSAFIYRSAPKGITLTRQHNFPVLVATANLF